MGEMVLTTSEQRTKPSGWHRFARKLMLAKLQHLQYGVIDIVDGDQIMTFGAGEGDLFARVSVIDRSSYGALVFGGTVGIADAYGEGKWRCNDLTSLFRILVLNHSVLSGLNGGGAWASTLTKKIAHIIHRNTMAGSRRNISAHYDLSNVFFELFLDKTMMYSSAIYLEDNSTLDEAAVHKVDRICQKLDLKPNDHVLEIGTGWGGFALHAAKNYGCRVTTTTISQEQYTLAKARFVEAGLEDRITILQKDYRDLNGEFDKLVSIEMIEAVGHEYFDIFFETCSKLLKPEGLMLLQAITISDWAYESAKHSVDFIKSRIFPGSCIPSVSAMSDCLARKTDLRTIHLEDIGPHYVRTLNDWRNRFMARLDDVQALVFSESFVRMWEYYLCYCEAGFAERYISTVQMLMAKPLNRRKVIVPSVL